MKLHLKTIGGKNWTFDVEPTDTIEHVKCQIFAADNVPVSHLVLTLQGRLLDNEHTLAHYDIQDGGGVVAGAWKWALVLLVAAVLVLQLRPELLQVLNGNISPRGYLKDGNVTLVYFDLRGRAEAIRLLLEESGVAYRDQRINGDTWATIKNDPRLLFGQVPLLQDGDLAIVQSLAIVKHIARVKGYYGQNYRERVMCDMVAGGAEDLRAKFYEVMYAPVELLDERKDRFLNETMPRWYQHFENLLLNNGAMYGGGKFFVGRSLSYADVLVYDTIDISSRLNPSLLNEYPLLRAFKGGFEARPAIREYQRTRRPTAIGGRHTHLYITA